MNKAFPPVNDLISYLRTISYKKHFHSFMTGIVITCAVIAAVYTVIATAWRKYNVTLHLQIQFINLKNGIVSFYSWMKNIFIPFCIQFYNESVKYYSFFSGDYLAVWNIKNTKYLKKLNFQYEHLHWNLFL